MVDKTLSNKNSKLYYNTRWKGIEILMKNRKLIMLDSASSNEKN